MTSKSHSAGSQPKPGSAVCAITDLSFKALESHKSILRLCKENKLPAGLVCPSGAAV